MPSQADIDAAIATPIDQGVDPEILSHILSHAPFVNIPGSFNSRDLGGSTCRPRYIFRSGTLEDLTEAGSAALHDIGIKTILDLRFDRERRSHPSPDIQGIKTIWIPSQSEAGSDRGSEMRGVSLIQMYLSLLDSHAAPFEKAFRHILEHPDQPILIHCTAGRDRTGVLAALILAIADTPLVEIERDYALTRIGTEPVRDFLTSKCSGTKPLDLVDPKVRAFAVAPGDAMAQLLTAINEKLGSVRSYLLVGLGFTEGEVDQIRDNLQSNSFR